MLDLFVWCAAIICALLGLSMILFTKKLMKKETIEFADEVSRFRKKGAFILVFAIIVLIYFYHKRCEFGYYMVDMTLMRGSV